MCKDDMKKKSKLQRLIILLFPNTFYAITADLYTLLMIDTDVSEDFGNEENPYAHWLVTNIPFGNISSGETVLSYRGSLPPYGPDHSYQFLLYKQAGRVDLDPYEYSPQCRQPPPFDNRCVVNI